MNSNVQKALEVNDDQKTSFMRGQKIHGGSEIHIACNINSRSEFMDSQKDFMSRDLSLNSRDFVYCDKILKVLIPGNNNNIIPLINQSNNQIIMINWFSEVIIKFLHSPNQINSNSLNIWTAWTVKFGRSIRAYSFNPLERKFNSWKLYSNHSEV
ncbi:hypothetical protein RCL_jg26362.t1 [Rhizophagus clarus]|uniref:Uncharacterized protein n=1 Tax=Rhizophagus clarus TaxID=94130 RepID=A0A8H3QDB4_9GLOM|nr:hypothetical protein RCL_jg26362.t1 [Rhizophagus clarus]